MRPFATVLFLAVAAVSTARAQSASEPSLAFTISGGLTTGGKLWRLDAQPLRAPGSSLDTVGLARDLVPGIAASLAMSLFKSPHIGLNGEIGYFSLASEQTCIAPANGYQADAPGTVNLNRQGCTTANGLHKATSAIAFLGGFMYRPSGTAHVQPFLRANAGLALLNNSFIETLGVARDTVNCNTSDNVCVYPLLSEQHKRGASWIVSVAGGFSFDLGPGYRVRMEGRDLILSIPKVTGPATPGVTNYPPTGNVVRHVPVFMIGFDVLLEQRRTRRY